MASKLPLVLNTNGSIERLQSGDILTGWEPASPSEGYVIQHIAGALTWSAFDHGGLSGLADDDHPQYHNDARAATWLANNHESTYKHVSHVTSFLALYVSTTGSDTTGDGTSGKPFASIDKALEYLDDYALNASVYVFIEKGSYPQTSNLHIYHKDSGLIQILGDRETDTLTFSSSSGSAGAYYLTFNTANTDYYTVNDYIFIYNLSGGTNPEYAYGVHKVTSINAGVSITVLSQHQSGAPSGSVTATASIPQVRWQRNVYWWESLKMFSGIQIVKNASGTYTGLLIINPDKPVKANIYYCITVNTSGSQQGYGIFCSGGGNVEAYYNGGANLRVGCRVDLGGAGAFTYDGFTNCVAGFEATLAAVAYHSACGIVDCDYGFIASYESLIHRNGTPIALITNTADYSPACGTEGNQNSWMV